jgi:5-methylcytosine-specific restriction endonuclease McrA
MATKSTPQKLAYQKAYNARPENVNKREANNRARQAALRSGKAKKGDDTQVDHIVPLDVGGSPDAKSNLRVIKRSENAAWRKRQPKMYGDNKK